MYRKAEILKLVTNNQMDVRSNFFEDYYNNLYNFLWRIFIGHGGHGQRALDGEHYSCKLNLYLMNKDFLILNSRHESNDKIKFHLLV